MSEVAPILPESDANDTESQVPASVRLVTADTLVQYEDRHRLVSPAQVKDMSYESGSLMLTLEDGQKVLAETVEMGKETKYRVTKVLGHAPVKDKSDQAEGDGAVEINEVISTFPDGRQYVVLAEKGHTEAMVEPDGNGGYRVL
ncbi:MAG: hypothetical protein OEY44_05000, partial [Candidatus Peregrinibacteria bacterium]|nr:hypothetical protein [Candidatus Peregrinibacteria bacterium]